MVEADFSGSFTNPLNCKAGDIGIVLPEAYYEEKKNLKGVVYKQLNLNVEINGKKLIHSPRMKEGQALIAAWGKNTDDWNGKQFKVKIVNAFVMGQEKEQVRIEPLVEKAV